jgi:hypothetical protein
MNILEKQTILRKLFSNKTRIKKFKHDPTI